MAQLYSVSRRFYFFNARRADHLLAGALQEDIIRAVVAGNPEAAAAAVDRLHDTMAIFADRVLTAAGSAAEAPPPAPPSRPEAG
jgi:hypothetical protein